MAAFYLKSGAGAAEFAQSTAYSLGNKIVPKRADVAGQYVIARRWVWECTTAGTSAAAEPTWAASVTQDVTTLTSGTAVFTARKPGFSSGTTADWAFATIYCDYLNSAVPGDVVYISDAHNEAIGAAYTPGLTGVYYTCVDDAAAPPTAETTGAIISTTGAFNLTIGGNTTSAWQGITFKVGIGDTGTRAMSLQGRLFKNCMFEISSSGVSSYITTTSQFWFNCTAKFAAAGHSMIGSPVFWSGGGLAAGSTSPTYFFGGNSALYGALVENLDLSTGDAAMHLAASNTVLKATFRNIKMPASWSGSINATAAPQSATQLIAFNVGTGALTQDFDQKWYGGQTTDESTLIRSGSDMSFKLAATSVALYPQTNLMTPELSKYNATTGSAITVTVDTLIDSATNLTDKDVILEVRYPSASDSPLGALATSDPGYMATAADLAASSATWTTTGMANPNKQKLTVTFTPQRAGFIHATLKLCKASATVYVDPVLQIS